MGLGIRVEARPSTRTLLAVAMRRVLPLAAVLVVLGAGSADGRSFGPVEEAAYQEAVTYWGVTPTLCTSVTKEVVAPGSLGVDEEGRDVAARADQPDQIPMPCHVWVEEDALGPQLCTILRHEYGHLLGYGHEDPALNEMPACEVTVPYIETPRERRREAWKLWRWARTECQMARGPYRKRCWNALRREAQKLRALHAPRL